MKKLIIFIFLLLFASSVQASEILGSISTDPSLINSKTEVLNTPSASSPDQVSNSPVINNQKPTGSSPVLSPKTDIKNVAVEKPTADRKRQAKVLGITNYPDGSLLKNSKGEIFFIKTGIKRRILNLQNLSRYAGQKIYQVSDEVLLDYKEGHLNSELVREKGTAKVYAITNGKKKHILNLEELRAHYFGLEIYNITKAEMDLY